MEVDFRSLLKSLLALTRGTHMVKWGRERVHRRGLRWQRKHSTSRFATSCCSPWWLLLSMRDCMAWFTAHEPDSLLFRSLHGAATGREWPRRVVPLPSPLLLKLQHLPCAASAWEKRGGAREHEEEQGVGRPRRERGGSGTRMPVERTRRTKKGAKVTFYTSIRLLLATSVRDC